MPRARSLHSREFPNQESLNEEIKLLVLLAAVIPFSMAVAGPMKGHPNLEAAEADLSNAQQHITKSQEANEWDAGGHAQEGQGADRARRRKRSTRPRSPRTATKRISLN